MNLELDNKRVLITGASKGIGAAIAKRFLDEGSVVIIVSRGSKELFDLEKELQEKYGKTRIYAETCDCANSKSLADLRERINKNIGGIDVLVANIGDGRSVPDILPDDEQWQKTWGNNFESTLQTTRTFLSMLQKSEGSLLFISSITGMEAFGAPTDYSTAKSAVIALAKNMSRKVASCNVRVNVVAPGNVYFKGGSWDKKIQEDKKKVDDIIKSTVPMNRFASPREIADSVVFLCSDRASFITGATLVIDGGQTVGVL